MLTKTVKTTNFEGESIEETLYFNLTKAEVQRMEVNGKYGSLANHFKIISLNKNAKETLDAFESILLQAYGERSEDGKRLIKSDEIREAFAVSEPYSDLLFEIATDADKATNFMKSIVPKEIAQSMEAQEGFNAGKSGVPQDYKKKQQ